MQLSLLAFKYSLWMTIQRLMGEGTDRKIHIFFFLIPLPVEDVLRPTVYSLSKSFITLTSSQSSLYCQLRLSLPRHLNVPGVVHRACRQTEIARQICANPDIASNGDSKSVTATQLYKALISSTLTAEEITLEEITRD